MLSSTPTKGAFMYDINLKTSGVKLAIIGTNFISDSLCEAARLTGLEVSAVYSRAPETGNEFAKKHGIKHVFCDFDEFLKSDTYNAAYVASPNFCHYGQTISLLEAGKHVLCEKPAASNLKEFSEMRRLSREKGLVFIEAMRPAYDPAVEILKRELTSLGKIRYSHIEYSQYSSRYDKFKNGIMTNAFDPSYSNAAVMDIGVYAIHVCVLLFGKPESVLSRSVKLDNGFEGQGNAILSYGDMTAEIAYSKITEAHAPSFVRGEQGEISFGHALSKIGEIRKFDRFGKEEKIDFIPAENNMIFELCAFCDFVAGKKDIEYYLDCTETTIGIIDEIRRRNGIVFPADTK